MMVYGYMNNPISLSVGVLEYIGNGDNISLSLFALLNIAYRECKLSDFTKYFEIPSNTYTRSMRYYF